MTVNTLDLSAAEGWTLPDDLDLGFDALINRYATHRLRDAEALARLRPDLARIIAPPEVVFAAYLADGSIVLCCPDGVPPELETAVDALDHLPLDRAPPPPPAPDLTGRLDDLSLKLDQIQRDRQIGVQIAERLEDVKSTLLERLAIVDPPLEVAPPLGASPALLEEMQRLLSESEGRMLALVRHANRAQNLSPQFEQIDQGMRQLLTLVADQPLLMNMLTQLEERVAALATRPAAPGDLIQQRQGFAQFLESMGTVLRRLDGAVDHLTNPTPDPRIADIGAQLETLSTQIKAARREAIDPAHLSGMLTTLRERMDEICESAAPTPAALHKLADQVQSLARRPDPVLDLTAQRQSFAQFSEAMARMLHRLEAAAAAFEHQRDDMEIINETRELRRDLLVPLTRIDAWANTVPDLHSYLDRIADRPTPVLDMTAQRQSLAQFAIAFGAALRRMEQGTEELHGMARAVQEMAAQTMLGVVTSQTVATPDADPEALRLSLAEGMASAFRRAGWQPGPMV